MSADIIGNAVCPRIMKEDKCLNFFKMQIDDAAAGSSGKVLITFDGKKLAVSNIGENFSFKFFG